ncbi:carboxypeptidase-like regulatory domain-containing protein [Aureibaculum luteum]|uniref:carboxypeptidase-like regulatory domain-containing protein n=1 Tax=Aureibaculum luteum TaxID=1548456 RepID=UPI000E4AFD84|nr:carboxypeptidase-like regulatory domain-containing protein [Aureibaculum luteum]
MKKYSFILLIFVSIQCLGQISGRILDKKTGLPISYVNIWIEKSWQGTTSDQNGVFHIDKGQVGDTLLISHLGYQQLQIKTKNKNEILLNPSEIELEEVVVFPIKNNKHINIKSFKSYKKIKEFNFFEHQAAARFFEYSEDYAETPFIKKISLAVITPLNRKQIFRVYLMKTDKEGKPSNQLFSEYKTIEIYGDGEINVDFTNEKLIFPEEGFFVVFDILNLKENIATNKFGHEVLCPAIGMDYKKQKKNTWLNYHGKWINPIERKKKSNEDRNVAINIELSN